MRIRRPGEPVEVDDSGARSWYASADLTACSEYEEQDPDLYRLMAAPRGTPTPEPEVEAATWEIGEGEGTEGFEELDTVLPEDLEPAAGDPPLPADRTLDDLLLAPLEEEVETLDLAGMAPLDDAVTEFDAWDAALLARPHEPADSAPALDADGAAAVDEDAVTVDADGTPAPDADLATLHDLLLAPLDYEDPPREAQDLAPLADLDEEPALLDEDSITPLDAGAPAWAPRAVAAMRRSRPADDPLAQRRRSARTPVPMLVPAYAVQCGPVDATGTAVVCDRSTPSRIARRLWQRDLDRIHA